MTLYASGVARFTVPAETPTDAHRAERVAAIDRQLAEIAAVMPILRTYVEWHRMDRLLDLRNRICPLPPLPDDYAERPRPLPLRPSVPVISGRAS